MDLNFIIAIIIIIVVVVSKATVTAGNQDCWNGRCDGKSILS